VTNPSLYLQPGGDRVTYGVECATDTQVVTASAIIDSYLRRPKGLVYLTDANGNPAMMAAAAPDMTYTLTAPIAPGASVVATLTPGKITPDFVGEVLVLEADSSPNNMEACLVTNVGAPGSNQVTLATVQFAHAAGVTAQTGLTLVEERSLPNKRSVTQLTETPVVNVLSLLGRYAYGRRSDQVGGLYQEMNLLASVQTFGGPPQWIPVDPTQASISDRTGEIWVPAGMLLAYYSDVRVRYIGGWTYLSLPGAIKTATASLANALMNFAGNPVSLAEVTVGTSGFKKFTASALDDDIQRMLNPYRARLNF
jgi:hypothetical protein